MKKLIGWLKDGGGEFIGYDNDGDPMFSASNGEALLFAGIILSCMIEVVAVLVMIWRLFV